MFSPILTIIGLVIGVGVAAHTGGSTYRALKRRSQSEILAAIGDGLATTVVASIAFTVLRIHLWSGPETSWRFSLFLGLCTGIWHTVMHRGELIVPRRANNDERGA